MTEADSLERSVAAALQLNEREVDHLIKLKQLRRTIEEGLTKDLVEDHELVPGQLPFGDTCYNPSSQDLEKRAAIADAEVPMWPMPGGYKLELR
jgi:hypothetical protein